VRVISPICLSLEEAPNGSLPHDEP
jgi:hypothetical protein